MKSLVLKEKAGSKGLPTVVDAIQKSGGITPSADLENVLIRRRLPGKIKNINKPH